MSELSQSSLSLDRAIIWSATATSISAKCKQPNFFLKITHKFTDISLQLLKTSSENIQDITREQVHIYLWQFFPSNLQIKQIPWDRKCLGSTCQGKSKPVKLSFCSSSFGQYGYQKLSIYLVICTEMLNLQSILFYSLKITTGSNKKTTVLSERTWRPFCWN